MERSRPKPPRHVELWGEIEANNHFLRRIAIGASVWAFLALAGAALALDLALFRPLAFHVDAGGQSTFLGRAYESAAPTEPEVRYVARHFLVHYAALNSLTIESDLAEAWNLMTDELRGENERQLTDYRQGHGKDFVAFVKEQGIQMVLDLRGDKTHVTEHDARVWTVRLVGTARTWPLDRVGDAAFSEKELEALVTLVRCPRTEKTPNGLLVAKVATRFFVADPATSAPPSPTNATPPGAPPAREESP